MDKLAMQLGQLRRLLRFNRFGSILRDYAKFPNAQNKTARDFFDMGYKLLMFAIDVLDIHAYLMELKVIKESNLKVLKKFIANLYFFECVTWTLLHLYEFFTKTFGAAILCLWVWHIVHFPLFANWFLTVKNIVS